ncbi:hybrid sensor histidine kinase/response regulator transcription factor [Maribellus sediminis]|uniref:hybrid sensor histidine kinase/response regulator transcription factor n=1 Tax=Maribellus sediminis TaxID=2696285 RepID=UPI0014302E67|nr:two-component regulator propeller domain-containing protein [Maribellus sediminis]
MISSKPIKLAILIIIGLYINSYASKVEKFGIERGLSNANVVSITQDRAGFIWICTKDGLNRFDSNTFQVFRASSTNPNSLKSNVLNFVYADKFDDVVWVASEKNGLDAYNYKTHEFTHFEHDYANPETNDLSANGVTYIDADDKGNLWIATYDGGIDFLDRKTSHFTNYSQSNVDGLISNYNWCVMYDSDDRIYVGHVTEGFSIINPRTKTAVNFKHDPNDPHSLTDNTVTSFLKDSKDRIWIGTRNGLNLFNPENGRMISFKNDPNNSQSISSNFIQKMIETPEHKLYIGTEGGGLNILNLKDLAFYSDPSEVEFEHILASETPDGLSNLSVQTVFQDSFGNIWLGGYGSGVNFIPKKDPFFNTINYLPLIGNLNSLNYKSVEDICIDNKNNVWVANGLGGICIYNENKKIGQIQAINGDPKFNAMCLHEDYENNIWIGTADGRIYKYDVQKKSYQLLKVFDNLNNIPIYNFFEDSRKNLWMSTDIGLYFYNIETKKSGIYTTRNSELIDNNVRAIAEDGNGNIWVGALGGGLAVYDENFKRLYDFGRSHNFYNVSYIYKDSRNRMWIGSQNDLFIFKNYNEDEVLRIGKSSGLAESTVRAIIEGRSDNEIWLSTINGISHIDLSTMHISNFDVSDGIVYGDYANGSVAKTDDGEIYFGSQNGITWFNQVLEQTSREIPTAVFTGFSIANTNNYLSQFSDVPFNDNMTLKHNQNSFEINFNVLDYSLANKAEFVYHMEGLDDGWFLVNTENEVTFRNLKPGSYVFNLKTRIQNRESEEVSSLSIRIEPPLWLTWWMKSIYLVLFTSMFLYVIRFYKRKLKVESDLILEKKSRQQEHELNEEKLRFFTNITHELRSPMTLILGPLEDLISDENLKPDQLKKLHMIQRVANRLLQTVTQILEFRKSENKSRKLTVIKDDFAKYLYEIGEKYKDLNKNKDIDLQIAIPSERIEMFFDTEIISIITDNLLSNAFKYTKSGTIKLELKLFEESNIEYAEILVSDTGYGISEEDLPHIFDRYYQARHATHPTKGTGIGLSLVKNMVELHEAEIKVTSTLGEGTEFKVRFLVKNSYPDAVHYQPEEPHMEEAQENSKNVILVVDDDPEIVEYIKESLSDTYSVITAENGEAGHDAAVEQIPDIIISDVMMPIMDGIEMCEVLKKDVRTSHIPIVLLTAKGSIHDQKVGYDAGADSYLTKPFSSNLLKSRLKNIIDARTKYSLSTSSKFKQKQQLLNDSIGELDKEFLRQLTSVIEENLEDEEMNISYVAAQLNMSHSTLYRKIKALTNLTANEFIRKVRINFAEQLLITGQYNISEIMYQVGINSSSYFRQCFKDEFGMNPSEYLQKLKEN